MEFDDPILEYNRNRPLESCSKGTVASAVLHIPRIPPPMDGSITVPEVLRPYMGGLEVIPAGKSD